MNKRDLRLLLLNDNRRKANISGHLYDCEGMKQLRHECQGPLEINEVLFPKNVFQKLPLKLHDYFYHPINCTINCRLFHGSAGHSRAWRDFFRTEIVDVIYGEAEVDSYIRFAPLKIKRVK